MATKPPALNDDSFEQASQVDPALVTPNAGERVLGMGVTPGGALDRRLQQYHAAKLAQAKMYRGNLANSVGQLAKGTKWDTTINGGIGGERPLTQDEIADLTAQKEEATKNYNKIVGVDPESKGALDKAHQIIDFVLQHKRQQQGRQGGVPPPPTPYYPVTVGDSGFSATPPPPGSTATVSDNPIGGGVSFTPPPPPRVQPSQLEQSVAAPFQQHAQKVSQHAQDTRQLLSSDVQGRQALVKQVIPQEDWNKPYVQDYVLTGNMTRGMIAHLQKTNMVNPDTGMSVIFNPTDGTYTDTQGNTVEKPIPYDKPALIGYAGPNNEPLFGTEQYGKLYDQQGNPLPPDTKKFYPALLPRHTVNYGMRQIPQPNGTIVQVPTVTVIDTTRGGPASPSGMTPSATPQGAGQKISPPPVRAGSSGAGAVGGGSSAGTTSQVPTGPSAPPAKSASYTQMMGLPKGSRVVGGKVPPGVSKAYDTYNGSQERFAIMEQALPKALKGDQQAMINLLYNHIGMTTGLQKGARITQPIIDEAQNSAPWMVTILKKIGVGNEFEMTPTLLRGVTLDPQTMHNMIGLAKERRDQDREAWIREIGAANTGYGMTTPPPPTPPETSTAPASGGNTLSYTDGGRNFNIPREMVKDFLKDHPNAKPR